MAPAAFRVRPATPHLAAWVLALGLLTAAAPACVIRVAPDYDPILDSSAHAVATKVNAFLDKMGQAAGTPAGEYAPNAAFYSDVVGELTTLRLRTAQQERAGKLEESVGLLLKSVDELRQLHQAGGAAGLSKPILGPARSAIETQFQALFAVENSLRRGK